MSDFAALQRALAVSLETRQAEARACEALLNALYHACRRSSGVGQPINNVSLELVEDPDNRMRPVPLGGWHGAWLRLGGCEVYVRVRRAQTEFEGEFGPGGRFQLGGVTEDTLLALARHIMRELARELHDDESAAPISDRPVN